MDKLSDVIVKIKDKELKLHKVILYNIPLFRTIFDGDWNTNVIEIDEYQDEIQDLIYQMYEGLRHPKIEDKEFERYMGFTEGKSYYLATFEQEGYLPDDMMEEYLENYGHEMDEPILENLIRQVKERGRQEIIDAEKYPFLYYVLNGIARRLGFEYDDDVDYTEITKKMFGVEASNPHKAYKMFTDLYELIFKRTDKNKNRTILRDFLEKIAEPINKRTNDAFYANIKDIVRNEDVDKIVAKHRDQILKELKVATMDEKYRRAILSYLEN